MKTSPVCIFWFRRDLRLNDNAGLYYALRQEHAVQPVFIFDTEILEELEDKRDKRVTFIFHAIEALQKQLIEKGASLDVRKGKPITVFKQLLKEYEVKSVYFNHDYEPYARARDKEIYTFLTQNKIEVRHFKDQVIFEKKEILKGDGTPYHVFTPYANKWKAQVNEFYLKSYPVKNYFRNFHQRKAIPFPSLEEIGFEKAAVKFPSGSFDEDTIRNYHKMRDIPSAEGTTRLGVHLRFGTVSIRELARLAKDLNPVFLKELIWREFFQTILWHYPDVVTESFKKQYDRIKWRNNEKEFVAWFEGRTGYPIVDAGMRELNETGYMHNRVRMIVASFLCKHLLIDWRWGEAYFAKKLLDYELASNNGNWQWAAGSGCDAAPYFRIFNPTLQTRKFDPQQKYIKKWVPEYGTDNYPPPLVEHEAARKRCLEAYGKAVRANDI